MRWLIVALLVVTAGCGPGGTAIMIAMLTQKPKKRSRPQQPFMLEIDKIRVDGSVSDNLDKNPRLSLNGKSVPVSNGNFSIILDVQNSREFVHEACDAAGNRKTLKLKIQ